MQASQNRQFMHQYLGLRHLNLGAVWILVGDIDSFFVESYFLQSHFQLSSASAKTNG